MNVEHYYDDSILWAFASSANKKGTLESDSTNISVEQSVSFMKAMSLIFNDGVGSNGLVTFIGVDFVNDMQQKGNIQKSDGPTMTAYPESLHFIENPDVASNPQTPEGSIFAGLLGCYTFSSQADLKSQIIISIARRDDGLSQSASSSTISKTAHKTSCGFKWTYSNLCSMHIIWEGSQMSMANKKRRLRIISGRNQITNLVRKIQSIKLSQHSLA